MPTNYDFKNGVIESDDFFQCGAMAWIELTEFDEADKANIYEQWKEDCARAKMDVHTIAVIEAPEGKKIVLHADGTVDLEVYPSPKDLRLCFRNYEPYIEFY